MIRKLNEIFETANNTSFGLGANNCIFKETLIFNEGWLLRAVLLNLLKEKKEVGEYGFIPFPDGVKMFSEGQLYSPFNIRGKGKNETNTHVDGIVGNIKINSKSKSGIELNDGCEYLAVFEAKINSGLSKRTTKTEKWNQVSRTIACMINTIIRSRQAPANIRMYYILIKPENKDLTLPSRNEIAEEIRRRLKDFESEDRLRDFGKKWKQIFDRIKIRNCTWELLMNMQDKEMMKYYESCLKYNKVCNTLRAIG